MKISFIYLLLLFLFESHHVLCKNILAIFPHFGMSHYFMYKPYIQKLQERGHNLTVITWLKDHNLKNAEVISFGSEIVPVQLNLQEYEKSSKLLMNFFEMQLLNEWGQKVCRDGLSNPEIKDFVNSKKRFDLVIVEYFNTDCYAAFAHLFNAPLVGIFSSVLMPWHNDRMGNPDNPSYIINMFSGYTPEMTFFQRVKNTFTLIFIKMYYKIFYNGPTDKIIKRHLGKGIPKVDDIVKNTSLFLVNSHYSLFQPRPFVPGVVEVGGIHIQPPKKLPPDLEKYLDDSKNGVIYFSLGTVTNGSSLPAKRRDALLKAFDKIPMNVLWKWEADDMPDKPNNVLIKKWVSQNDVLAHPNVKLFITHGGLMGTLEAVSHGVPMIFIPLFGDQFINAACVAEKGAGIVYDYFSIAEPRFSRTLQTVLEDKRKKTGINFDTSGINVIKKSDIPMHEIMRNIDCFYYRITTLYTFYRTRSFAEKAKLLSAIFKERPLTPMNSAIYWTEYVLKFKGAPHMRPAVMKLSWFSEYLIDVALFSIIFLFLVVFVVKKIVIKITEAKKVSEEIKKKKK